MFCYLETYSANVVLPSVEVVSKVMAPAKGVRNGFLKRPVLSPSLKLSKEMARLTPSSVGMQLKSILGRLFDLLRSFKLTSYNKKK